MGLDEGITILYSQYKYENCNKWRHIIAQDMINQANKYSRKDFQILRKVIILEGPHKHVIRVVRVVAAGMMYSKNPVSVESFSQHWLSRNKTLTDTLVIILVTG